MPGHDPVNLQHLSAPALLPDPLPESPLAMFKSWFDEAHTRAIQPNPNAMTLATIDPDGKPAARIVLIKGLDLDNGFVVFYTNYTSRKGLALTKSTSAGALNRAACVIHWDVLDRQVRIEGPVVPSPAEESDAYFRSRPWISRVGAWASQQSQPVASRAEMDQRVLATLNRFGVTPGPSGELPPADGTLPDGRTIDIPRPPHWGGFRIYIERMELWIGAVGRLHDRAAWERVLRPEPAGQAPQHFTPASPWCGTRLQP
jgi:pyridoxamine 5'-phosphate oxidase